MFNQPEDERQIEALAVYNAIREAQGQAGAEQLPERAAPESPLDALTDRVADAVLARLTAQAAQDEQAAETEEAE